MKNNNILSQSGFTLLELMVAMSIFAVLAVAGWQVFDGLNRSKDRAQLQATALSEMQYAYLQIQKDMAQVVPYQLDSGANSSEGLPVDKGNGLTLSDDSISLIRFADPDPRYQNSALLERVVYRIADNRLIRQRFRSLSDIENQTPIESVLLAEISEGHFQALTPEPASIFPDKANPAESLGAQQGLNSESQQEVVSPALLPKGITVDYVYQLGSQSVPISWQFSLTDTPPNPVSSAPKPNDNEDGRPL